MKVKCPDIPSDAALYFSVNTVAVQIFRFDILAIKHERENCQRQGAVEDFKRKLCIAVGHDKVNKKI